MPRHDGIIRSAVFADSGHSWVTRGDIDSERAQFVGNFTTTVSEPDRVPTEARELIRTSRDSAIVLIEDYDGLTTDMIFNKAQWSGGESVKVTCIFSRNSHDEHFGKEFVIPYEKLTSYQSAIEHLNREFLEEGDFVVGLETSRIYSITSIRSGFIGSIVPIQQQDYFTDDIDGPSGEREESTVYVRHRYGEASLCLRTVFSTQGRPGETHHVTASCFIPVLEPENYLENTKDLGIEYIALHKDSVELKAGFMYPVSEVKFVNKKLQVCIAGVEETFSYGDENVRLVNREDIL